MTLSRSAWYDTTKDLSAEQFNDWLTAFAGDVERAGRSGVLVDATQFRMDMAAMDFAFRDANIIPDTTPPASRGSRS